MKKVIFINSHPIQYFAPLYKYMNELGIKTEAWYCSDESIKGKLDPQFGVNVKWDIELLEGYKHHFFKNQSWASSSVNSFLGLINLGMALRLFTIPKSVIIVHGWHYLTHLLIILLGKIKGHTVCIRCELPQNQEIIKYGWKQTFKRIGLKYVVFPRIDYFLYIGSQNRLFYRSYGILDDQLLFCPYSVDNTRFTEDYNRLKSRIPLIKEKLSIPKTHKVILYSGKYIQKKRPLDVLNAFKQLNKPECWLIMVGEGEMRSIIEEKIREYKIKNVILTGFINQAQISEYYAISDVFVMCSSIGETWGLSVNEAMNFNIPIVVSNLTGCSEDLVEIGLNGFIFETGNTEDLCKYINDVLFKNILSPTLSSRAIIEKYSYLSVALNISKIL